MYLPSRFDQVGSNVFSIGDCPSPSLCFGVGLQGVGVKLRAVVAKGPKNVQVNLGSILISVRQNL